MNQTPKLKMLALLLIVSLAQPAAIAAEKGAQRLTSKARPKPAPKAEEKLAIYISAGSLKGFKRPLRTEQRKNRNRFFMWLGLSFFALWIIWFVIR